MSSSKSLRVFVTVINYCIRFPVHHYKITSGFFIPFSSITTEAETSLDGTSSSNTPRVMEIFEKQIESSTNAKDNLDSIENILAEMTDLR